MSTSENAAMRSQFNVGRLVWFIIRVIISNIVMAVIGVLLSITVIVPIVMVICAIANTISGIISVISYCCTYATITDNGLKGRAGFRGFELTFDQIGLVESAKKSLVINTTIPKKEGSKKMRVYMVQNIKNSDEFKAAYVAAAASAQPVAEPVSEPVSDTIEE